MASSSSSSLRRRSEWRSSRKDSFFSRISPESDRKTCPICLVAIRSSRLAFLPPCSHAYCADCIQKWSNVKRKCPLCNATFDSWLYDIDFRRRTFSRCKLAPLRSVPEVGGGFGDESRRPASRRVGYGLTRRREESSRSEYSRSRPLPRRRSFRLSASEELGVVAERVLQWRASIYRQNLRAVCLSLSTSLSRNCSQQNISGIRGSVRVNPWVRRELQAILGDPDPTIIAHVVTSLYASSLREGTNDPEFLAPLRPFLSDWTDLFWHELRCFAESSLTMETYDTVVSYERIRG